MKIRHLVSVSAVSLFLASAVGAQSAPPVTANTTCADLLPGINNVYGADSSSRTGVEYLDRTGKLVSSMSRSASRSAVIRDGGARSAGQSFPAVMLASIVSNSGGKPFRGIVKKMQSKDSRNSTIQTFACVFKRSGGSWSAEASEYSSISASASKGTITAMPDRGDASSQADRVYVVGAHGSVSGTGIDTKVDLFLTVDN